MITKGSLLSILNSSHSLKSEDEVPWEYITTPNAALEYVNNVMKEYRKEISYYCNMLKKIADGKITVRDRDGKINWHDAYMQLQEIAEEALRWEGD